MVARSGKVDGKRGYIRRIDPPVSRLSLNNGPYPQREIRVAYERRGKSFTADVVLPEKLRGWFYWGGTRVALHGGRQHLAF